jgi:hypothetical protein
MVIKAAGSGPGCAGIGNPWSERPPVPAPVVPEAAILEL